MAMLHNGDMEGWDIMLLLWGSAQGSSLAAANHFNMLQAPYRSKLQNLYAGATSHAAVLAKASQIFSAALNLKGCMTS